MADPEQPTNDADQALDFGKKKKKKKAKEDLFKENEPETTSATPVPATPAASASVEATAESEKASADAAPAADGEATEEIDFGKKKRGKTKVKFDEEQNDVIEIPNSEQEAATRKKEEQKILTESDSGCDWQNSDRDYRYDELLTRVFNIMREKNPDMITGEKRKFVMKPPQVARVGTKKTSFSNFADICKLLRRQEKHLLNFLLAELGTSGSLDINKQLTIKGRFQQKQIENVLRRYIKEYVTCHTCRSPETNMVKEERLFFLKCETCGATCTVASIKSGFQAQVGKRAALRARAT